MLVNARYTRQELFVHEEFNPLSNTSHPSNLHLRVCNSSRRFPPPGNSAANATLAFPLSHCSIDLDMSTMRRTASQFLRGLATNRWLVVVATFFIMACSGATYNFGIYSPVIKSSLGYNQETLTTVGFFKDLGANVGIFSGLLYDVTGPWVVLLCGAILNLFGYLMIWLAVTQKISRPPLWQICLYICIGANSQAFTNTGVIVTSVKNFPNNRGLVIGLLKGYVGLSGAMLTLAYQALYGNKPASFILLIAWAPCVVCFSFMLIIRRMKPSGPEMADAEKKIFNVFLVIALVLAGYLMIIIIVQHLHGVHFPRVGFQVLFAVMLVIVMTPLSMVVRDELKNKGVVGQQREAAEETHPPQEETKSIELSTHDDPEQQNQAQSSSPSKNFLFSLNREKLQRLIWERPERGSDYNIPEAIFSIDMLTIFIATTCGVGGGLMAIDNLGQIGASLGYHPSEIATFVSLISIWNFLGRVSSGFFSDIALRRFAVPRTLFFALVMAVAAIGHIIIAFALPGALYAGSILIGLTFGAQWALMFTIISEIFGLKYYGTLYNVGGVASPLGSYLLSVRVAGSLYDREAEKDAGKKAGRFLIRRMMAVHSENHCFGAHCFRTTFFIMAAVCVLGCLVALILTVRTRRFYRGIFLRLKEHKDAPESSPVKSF